MIKPPKFIFFKLETRGNFRFQTLTNGFCAILLFLDNKQTSLIEWKLNLSYIIRIESVGFNAIGKCFFLLFKLQLCVCLLIILMILTNNGVCACWTMTATVKVLALKNLWALQLVTTIPTQCRSALNAQYHVSTPTYRGQSNTHLFRIILWPPIPPAIALWTTTWLYPMIR